MLSDDPHPTAPLLFAYGTLLPGEPRWAFLEPYVVDEGRPTSVSGRLYDTGRGYPAARFARDGASDSARIVGRVFHLDPALVDEALTVLDEVEGAVAGLYRRVDVQIDSGERAAAYEYGDGLDLRPIDSGNWLDRS